METTSPAERALTRFLARRGGHAGSLLRARGRLASLGRPFVLALERLELIHLSRSSFLHNGASMCVWHHSATACSTSERVMPRGLGSISSITLPEGGGELRVGNSRQAMKPRRTASWLESRCPVMRSSVLTISEQA